MPMKPLSPAVWELTNEQHYRDPKRHRLCGFHVPPHDTGRHGAVVEREWAHNRVSAEDPRAASVIANFTKTERERIKALHIVVTALKPQDLGHPTMLMLPVEFLPSGGTGYAGEGYGSNGITPADLFEQVVSYSLEQFGIERLPTSSDCPMRGECCWSPLD
jgi:hypothetical protein